MKRPLLSVLRQNTKLLNSILFFTCWSQLHAHANSYYLNKSDKVAPVNVTDHSIKKDKNRTFADNTVDNDLKKSNAQDWNGDAKSVEANLKFLSSGAYDHQANSAVKYYGSDIKEGVIGVDSQHPIDQVYDNIFNITIDDKINSSYTYTLEYDLFGAEDYKQVSKVINDEIAVGGGAIKKNNVWTHQSEPISESTVNQGKNTVVFTLPYSSKDLYKVRNLRIGVSNKKRVSEVGSSYKALTVSKLVSNLGNSEKINLSTAELAIEKNTVKNTTVFSVTALRDIDMPALSPEMVNVTSGNTGYRFLPHGEHFSAPAKVSLGYDKNKIPDGYTEQDIKTYYFDRTAKKWTALDKDSVNYKQNQLVSKTTHFTDMINGVLKVPESPETGSYAPNSIKDIKAANPSEGIVSIAPPTANSMGSVTTSFPIKVPAGRAGMQPSLSVNYSSEGGNGWMGLGWDLSIPAISIDTRWGVPRYDNGTETETYTFGGEQLTFEVANGVFAMPNRKEGFDKARQNDRQFYPRIEGSYNKIIRKGTNPQNYVWIVTSKDGTKSYFGGDENGIKDSTVLKDAHGNIGYWALYKIVDANQNYIEYKYDCFKYLGSTAAGAQEIYPKTIEYTLHKTNNTPQKYAINFETNGSRDDIQIDGRLGFLRATSRKLTDINITYGDSKVRSYKFKYKENAAFNKTLLESIQELDANGAEFYTNRIEYEDAPSKIFADAQDWTVSESANLSDNYSMISGSTGTSVGTSFGLGVGLYNVASGPNGDRSIGTFRKGTIGAHGSGSKSNSDVKITLIDIDGDNLPDRVYEKNGKIYYSKNKSKPGGSQEFAPSKALEGNISAIGKTDVATWGVGINGNFSDASLGFDYSNSTTTTKSYFMDFNNDGLVDFVKDGKVYFNRIVNGIPTFSEDSGSTPYPIKVTSSLSSQSLFDTEDEAEKKMMLDQNPLHDVVRVWVAPKSGTITVKNKFNLKETECPEGEDCSKADGVAVAFQYRSNMPLVDNINAGDYTVHSFADQVININKGEKLYFRVTSKYDGTKDQVAWDPEIIYSVSQVPAVDSDNKSLSVYKAGEDFVSSSASLFYATAKGTLSLYLDKPIALSDDAVVKLSINDNDIPLAPILSSATYNNSILGSPISLNENDKVQIKVNTDTQIDWSNFKLIPEFVDSIGKKTYLQVEYTMYNDRGDFSNYTVVAGDVNKKLSVRASSFPNFNGKNGKVVISAKMKNRLLTKTVYTVTDDGSVVTPVFGLPYTVQPNDVNNTIYLETTVSSDNRDFIVNTSGVGGVLTNNRLNYINSPNTLYKQYSNLGVSSHQGYVIIGSGATQVKFEILNYDSPWTSATLTLVEQNGNVISFPELSAQPGMPKEVTVQIPPGNYTYNLIYLNYGVANLLKYAKISILSGGNETILKNFSNVPHKQVLASLTPTQALNSNQYDSRFGILYRGWGAFVLNGNNVSHSTIQEAYSLDANYANKGTQSEMKVIESALALSNAYGQDPGTNPPVNPPSVNENDGTVTINDNASSLSKNYFLMTNSNVNNGDKGRWLGIDPNVYVSKESINPSRLGVHSIDANFDNYSTAQIAGDKLNAPSIKLKSQGVSVAGGYSPGMLGVNSSRSVFSEAKSVRNVLDYNGDGFPDDFNKKNIKLTSPLGGPSGLVQDSYGVDNHQSISSATAKGVSTGMSFTHGKPETKSYSNTGSESKKTSEKTVQQTAETAIESKKSSTKLSVNLSGEESGEKSKKTFVDINGDGLPDLYDKGKFSLNVGKSQFAGSADWNVQEVSISNGISGTLGAGGGVSFFRGSFEGGVSNSFSENNTVKELLDINGDGLPDRIEYNGTSAKVYINNGNIIGNDLLSVKANATSLSTNIGGNIAGTAIIPMPLSPSGDTGIKLNITIGASLGKSDSKTKSAFRDMNGDGYPDFVTSDGANNIKVSLNQIGTTNLLKKVTTPMGGSWEVAYERVGNTYDMPQSKYVMKSVVTHDGFTGDNSFSTDVSKITISYEKPYHSRWERTFYGFEKVNTNQIDTKQGGAASNIIYRKTIQKFNNKNYYLKGTLLDETMLDKDNNVWSKKANIFVLKNIRNVNTVNAYLSGESEKGGNNFGAFVARQFVQTNFYDGTVKIDNLTNSDIKKSTRTMFRTYDSWGNVTDVQDFGDTDIGISESLTHKVVYTMINPAAYIVMPVSVKNTAQGVTREKKATYNPANGNLIKMIIPGTGTGDSVYDMEYDVYGNITKSTGPENYAGQRFSHQYTYDDNIKTYPVKVQDAFGYSSKTKYDYRFGLPVFTEDMNLQPMKYVYDAKARATEITGPYEMFNNIPWTIKFDYQPITNAPANASNAQSYAFTKHYDPEHTGNTINTITIADGFGKAIQVKKTGDIYGEGLKYIVAGKVKEDAFGRALETYYPTVESINSDNTKYNAAVDNVEPTINKYDVLDRVIYTKLPGEDLFSSVTYGFANDVQGRKMFETIFKDELGSIKKSYTDIKGRTTSVHEVSNTGDIKTQFTHDAIGEVLQVKDVQGNITTSVYDNLGRRISYKHPDTGITTYKYDRAGNMISKTNSANEEVKYQYDYTRLKEVNYPLYPENNVKYYYGNALDTSAMDNNAVGRLWYQTDATGTQYLKYGRLGELIYQRRSVAVPGAGVYWFGTEWQYDTWNRVKTITYPDGEKVNYKYNKAGNLINVASVKDGNAYPMIDHLGYDKFEQRVYLKNGNGTETTYEYETNRRRLLNMYAKNSTRYFMKNTYQYDVVSNVMQIHNNAPVADGLLGGGTNHAYGYDDLYRLTSASGNWRGINTQNQEERHRYSVTMTYDNMHNIMSKTQKHEWTTGASNNNWTALEPTSYRLNYKYEDAAHPHAPSTVVDEQNLVPSSTCCNPDDPGVKFQHYRYDAKGNPLRINQETCNHNEGKAAYKWDEENRLRFVDTNPSTTEVDGSAIYTYDAGGERIIKDVLYSGFMNRVIGEVIGFPPMPIIRHNATIYPNGLLTMNISFHELSLPKLPRYTKHYYAGNQRIVSKIGTSNDIGTFNCEWNIIPFSGGSLPINPVAVSDTILQEGTQSNLNLMQEYGITPPPNYGQNAGSNGNCVSSYPGSNENRVYWFHPDHLGSSSYITGVDGEVTQNIEYFPSGEVFVENHRNSNHSPYKFNAKELDGETGYYYYGARYYNPRVSLWLNVDPLAEEYPSLSPYIYVANNPINFIDPDGNRIKPSSNWKGAGNLKFNLLYFNALYNKNHSDKNDRSAFSCSMCCINALEDNLSLLYSNRLKRLDNYDKMMQQVRQLGYRGDREIAQPTLNGKTLNSSNSVAEFTDKNFNTGIVDNLLDQLKGNKGVYVFGVGIANGYHSTIVTAYNDGTKVRDNANNITYTSSGKNPIFVFVEDNGGARVFTAKQLEAKFQEYYISAAKYYSGQKPIDGKTVSNTGAKDMGARIDNLEYKKTK